MNYTNQAKNLTFAMHYTVCSYTPCQWSRHPKTTCLHHQSYPNEQYTTWCCLQHFRSYNLQAVVLVINEHSWCNVHVLGAYIRVLGILLVMGVSVSLTMNGEIYEGIGCSSWWHSDQIVRRPNPSILDGSKSMCLRLMGCVVCVTTNQSNCAHTRHIMSSAVGSGDAFVLINCSHASVVAVCVMQCYAVVTALSMLCVCIFSLGTPIVLSLSGLGPRQSTSHLAIGDKVGHKQRMDRTIRHFLFSMVLLSIRCMSVCNCKGQHCYVMKNACSMPSFVQPAKWS